MNAQRSRFPVTRTTPFGAATPVKFSQQNLVSHAFLKSQEQFLQVVEARSTALNLGAWIRDHRSAVENGLLNHGGILFRGFDVTRVSQFKEAALAVSNNLLDYTERAAPRTQVDGNIYTSTEFSNDHVIPLHHEMSYSHNWPAKIFFWCQKSAEKGGATPVANDIQVFQQIDSRIKERFCKKGVMYMRNFGPGFDRWQDVFQTNSRADVEMYCRQWRIQFHWLDRDRLRTRQVRQAVATHPQTGQTVWFNHAHMFHLSNLAPIVRESLLAMGSEADLPRNAYYGDGSAMEDSILDEIRAIYREEAVRFTWRSGDVLVLDNLLTSHGRDPFSGSRSILVAMADLYIDPEFENHAGI